jgi:glycosyltransferase involved in cell wall biosynthesis
MTGPAGAFARPPVRTAVVGVSSDSICGVRDYATLQADALGGENVSCSMHWLNRTGASFGTARSEFRSWKRELLAGRQVESAEVALLHYSVFPFSYRGVPAFVRPTLAALRGLRIPLITVLHEFAYPWGRDGLRGAIWAVSQRGALIDVMRASAAVVLTTDFRVEWLAARPWLPRRPAVVAPVFSNLPPSALVPQAHAESRAIGLFGYGYEQPTVSLVLDAVRALQSRGFPVGLELLGAPGRSSPVAGAWLDAAQARGMERAVTFSGTLSAQELSDRLAACDVLLFADPSGPTSRKTTLAASLASGRPVVAVDGPRRWAGLTQSEAALVVEPTPRALANALGGLLAEQSSRTALGARGRAFAERNMSVAGSARVVAEVLHDVAG